jgi:hypothetical protein
MIEVGRMDIDPLAYNFSRIRTASSKVARVLQLTGHPVDYTESLAGRADPMG